MLLASIFNEYMHSVHFRTPRPKFKLSYFTNASYPFVSSSANLHSFSTIPSLCADWSSFSSLIGAALPLSLLQPSRAATFAPSRQTLPPATTRMAHVVKATPLHSTVSWKGIVGSGNKLTVRPARVWGLPMSSVTWDHRYRAIDRLLGSLMTWGYIWITLVRLDIKPSARTSFGGFHHLTHHVNTAFRFISKHP